jgi:hypothetical protein
VARVTAPYVPGPGSWPPPVPPPPPKRPLRLGRLIALLVLGVVVLCVGGTAAIGAIVGSPDPKPKAAADSQRGILNPVATTAAADDPGPAVVPAVEPTPTKAAPAVAPATTKAHPRPTPSTHKPSTKPKPKPKPKPSATTKPPVKGVHPGAFCSPKGAFGLTTTGKLMQCKPSATDTRNRWRAA